MNNFSRIIQLISQIRQISQCHLPVTTSFIPYDILVYLYRAYANQELVNLKEFFLQFKHSEMGVRYHLKQLIDDGWISLKENPSDKRSKVLVMSPIFVSNMEKTLLEIAAYIEQQAALAKSNPASNNSLQPDAGDVGHASPSQASNINGHPPP